MPAKEKILAKKKEKWEKVTNNEKVRQIKQQEDKNVHLYFTLRTAEEGLALPIHYNHLLQGAIYGILPPELASFFHEQGFETGGRRFKLFTFSRLMGERKIDQESKKITFRGEVRLVVASPLEKFCTALAWGFLNRGFLRLGDAEVEVVKMAVQHYRVTGEEITVRTLSPVVAYSTFYRPDGRKYTCYFQPAEPEFDSLITANLRKKYQALYGCEPPPGEVMVKKVGKGNWHVLNYKGTIVKGYSGPLRLAGPPELLQIAIDAGLGSKNAQGFGCLEIRGGGRSGR